MHDFLLAEQARRGNREALQKLVEKYYCSIYNYIFFRVSDREAAKDLTQETFYRLAKSIHRYLPTAKFSTFLYQIAHNLVVDHYRREKSGFGQATERGDAAWAEQDAAGRDPGRDAARQVEQKIDVAAVLRRIPEEQRECLILYYYQELKYTEIADILEIPVSTAKTRVRRGLASCRRIMEKEGYREG